MLKKINRITEKYFKLEHFYNMGETVSWYSGTNT